VRSMRRTFVASLLLLCACSKTDEPRPSVAAASSASVMPPIATATAPSSKTTPVADIAWDVPSAWKTVPNASAMRKATYRVTKAAGDPDDAEMTVMQAGGSVDANVERWAGQFEAKEGAPAPKATREERTMGLLKVTVVELAGTFNGGGMPGAGAAGSKSAYALLAAIVEGTESPYFFKLVGPEKTVRAARADFDKLVGSMKPR
jgi:hypothetical protein